MSEQEPGLIQSTASVSAQESRDVVLAALFGSRARVAVLRLFMLDPLRAYYQRQIESATGLPIRAVQRELERLASIDLLYRRVEGNRTYYQVDVEFAVFPELRGMVLKTSGSQDQLRGSLALDRSVRLLFFNATQARGLVVMTEGKRLGVSAPEGITLEAMTEEAFVRALSEAPDTLEPFLVGGVDLLGRRDDVIWRRIEAVGYSVEKGKGVP